MNVGEQEFDLSGKATRSTVGGIANFLGWLALGVLAWATAGHAVSITMAWANLNPAGGDLIALLALVGVALVEVFAVLTAVLFATHSIRAKQKPVAMTIEGLWFMFAAVNLISSFAMKHGGAMPAFVGYWVTYGLPVAGLIVGGLFYVVMRLNPNATRAEDKAELRETLTTIEHNAEVEVLNSEQMKAVIRQMMWQKMPHVIGRQLNLSEAQIAALTGQAPRLLDLNRNGIPDIQETRGAAQAAGDMDLEDLVTYLVEERLRERAAQPVTAYDNGHGQPARPTSRPDGR